MSINIHPSYSQGCVNFTIVDFPTNVSVQMLIKNIHSLDELHMVSRFNQIYSKKQNKNKNKRKKKSKQRMIDHDI